MNKKAYTFMLDATIAIVIMVVALTLLFYQFFKVDRSVYFTEQISEDIIGVMSYTTLPDICVNLDASGCKCPNYLKIEVVACSNKIKNKRVTLLEMINEGIETGTLSGDEIKDIIRDIFVNKKIIDKKRFGFAILYTKPTTGETFEIYNTEVDDP